ncbi:MAG: hypothetical protein ACK5AT_15375, partial [Bradyrhizobium sp.]
MTHFLRDQDLQIWLAARPWLDVRSNDEHTLISYRLGQALLRLHPDVDASVVLPAILMHDVGGNLFQPTSCMRMAGSTTEASTSGCSRSSAWPRRYEISVCSSFERTSS